MASGQITLTGEEYFYFIVHPDLAVSLSVGSIFTKIILAVVVLALIARAYYLYRGGFRAFEVDQAQLGIGSQKFTLRPNNIDRQIAYKIWVELSTRKIGLPIDASEDVVAEIYDSWYNFFTVTRELIKDIPVSKFRRKDTEKIVRLSIDILNEGLRPHLTTWQAKFRRWLEFAESKEENKEKSPQDIQKEFPQYDELVQDLLAVNKALINYRAKMREIIGSDAT